MGDGLMPPLLALIGYATVGHQHTYAISKSRRIKRGTSIHSIGLGAVLPPPSMRNFRNLFLSISMASPCMLTDFQSIRLYFLGCAAKAWFPKGVGWADVSWTPRERNTKKRKTTVPKTRTRVQKNRTPQSAHHPHKNHIEHRNDNPGGGVYFAALLGFDNSYTTPSRICTFSSEGFCGCGLWLVVS